MSAPAPGLYTGINHDCFYNIRLQRDFLKLVTNDRSDKIFLLTSKFCPQEVVSPGAIYVTGNMYNQGICIIPKNFREYV